LSPDLASTAAEKKKEEEKKEGGETPLLLWYLDEKLFDSRDIPRLGMTRRLDIPK
jgi:hypothetical protein